MRQFFVCGGRFLPMVHELWPGGPRLKEDSGIFRLGVDSVLLAFFSGKTTSGKNKRVADLGCGSGLLSILLAWHDPKLQVDAIEIQPDAAALAAENAELNGLSDRIRVIGGDLRLASELMRPGAYDIVVSNPPYYKSGSGRRPASNGMAIARTDELCTLKDVCTAAGYLTRWGGSFMLVHKPERLAEVFRAVSESGFEPKRLRFVSHKNASPPNLVLIESRRGAKPSLKVEAPLFLYDENGNDSDEFITACGRQGGSKL